MSKAILFIGGLITTPIAVVLQIVGLFLRIPNTKIVYKSGHVEYYFFENLEFEGGGGGKKLEWKSPTLKKPIFANVGEIESIVKIW